MISVHNATICAIYSRIFIWAMFLKCLGIMYDQARPCEANPPKPYSEASQMYTILGFLKVRIFILTPSFTFDRDFLARINSSLALWFILILWPLLAAVISNCLMLLKNALMLLILVPHFPIFQGLRIVPSHSLFVD